MTLLATFSFSLSCRSKIPTSTATTRTASNPANSTSHQDQVNAKPVLLLVAKNLKMWGLNLQINTFYIRISVQKLWNLSVLKLLLIYFLYVLLHTRWMETLKFSLFFALKKLTYLLLVWKVQWQKDREAYRETFHSLVHSTDVCRSQELHPSSPMGDWNWHTGAIIYCLPSTVMESWVYISKVLKIWASTLIGIYAFQIAV